MLPERKEQPSSDPISQRELEDFVDLEALYLKLRNRLAGRMFQTTVEPGGYRLNPGGVQAGIFRLIETPESREHASVAPIARLFDESLAVKDRLRRFRFFWAYQRILSAELKAARRASRKAEAIGALGAREFHPKRSFAQIRRSMWMIRWAAILYLSGVGNARGILRFHAKLLIETVELTCD